MGQRVSLESDEEQQQQVRTRKGAILMKGTKSSRRAWVDKCSGLRIVRHLIRSTLHADAVEERLFVWARE